MVDKKWRSIAVWPDGTIAGEPSNTSSDTHHTFEQAQGVCRELNRNGFGGENKIYPINTFVEFIR